MQTIHFVLFFVALLGFMPLGIILFKKNRVKKILSHGVSVKAVVYDIMRMSQSASEIVYYSFYAQNSTQQYTGKLTTDRSRYKIGDGLDIFYLPGNPRRNSMNGAWGSPVITGFGIVMAIFVLFAVYKMYEMVQSGSM
ncbi:MAG: DUF3592 domain-containing protein [Ferruginibacter sp.]